jgi:hypothetical protein
LRPIGIGRLDNFYNIGPRRSKGESPALQLENGQGIIHFQHKAVKLKAPVMLPLATYPGFIFHVPMLKTEDGDKNNCS